MLRKVQMKLLNAFLSLFAITLNIVQPFAFALSAASNVAPAYAQEASTIPSDTPTPTPDATLTPSSDPVVIPSADPAASPSVEPAASPSTAPSVEPTVSPVASPISSPTTDPSPSPTDSPIPSPGASPTLSPQPSGFNFRYVEPTSATIAANVVTYAPIYDFTIDTAGANDEPGQKDLTLMGVDDSQLTISNILYTTWNWDEIDWSGANTGDACNLFDTNGNGLADYSLCTVISGSPAVFQSHVMYSCGDARADRCTNPIVVIPSSASCTAEVTSTDPFNGAGKLKGDAYPKDTSGYCSIPLSDFGSSEVTLIDVCSYPSNQPNSDPSDCIVAQPKTGRLEVVKNLIPDTDPGLFNLQIAGTTYAANIGNGGTTGEKTLSINGTGTVYSVGESQGTNTLLTNYSSAISCKDVNGTGTVVASAATAGPLNVTLHQDDDVVCTITNTRVNNATLTIVKDAVPNDAQDFAFTATGSGLSNFILDDDADITRSNTQVFSNLSAGSYSVVEGAVAGWVQTSATCTNGNSPSAITLTSGANVTCTFVNSKQPTLELIKTVVNNNGGNATIADFVPQIDGTASVWNNPVTVATGSHTASEVMGVTGYTPSAWGTDCAADGTVSLAYGDHKTCTITNDDQPATLHVVKVVHNDNGGSKTFADFSFQVNSGATVAFEADGQNDLTVPAGTYSVTEPAVAGYTASYNNCSGIVIPNGGSATCTITNDDNAPSLTLVKHVTKDNGGTAVAADWTLSASGPTPISGAGGVVSGADFTAGTYNLSESAGPAGYTPSSWSCVGGTQVDGDTVTIALGESAVCTITNDDQPGTLIVKKVISGGTKQFADFSFSVNSAASTNFDIDGQNEFTVNKGVYSVTETADTDYNTSYDNCTSVLINNGETKTCTVTNVRKTGMIFIDKILFGGTAVDSDWLFTVTDPTGQVLGTLRDDGIHNSLTLETGSYTITESSNILGYTLTAVGGICSGMATSSATLSVTENGGTCTFTNTRDTGTITVRKETVPDGDTTKFGFSGQLSGSLSDGQELTASVDTGEYTVTESPVNGWDLTSIACSDTDSTGSLTSHAATFRVAKGENITCTFTNSRRPTLTINKVVTNDDGGTAVITDFQGKINDTNVSWGSAQTLDPGVYTASESTLPTYTASAWTGDCAADGSVTLAYGDTKSCSVTNDDKPATLIVKKVLVNDNGGDKTVEDFSFQVNNDPSIAFEADGQNDLTVDAGTYTVVENAADGYSTSYDNCTGLVILNGGSATCTITNNDIAPSLHLHKVVVNDNGGTALASAWTLQASGPTGFTGQGPDVSNGVSFDAATYTLSESGGPNGYDPSGWICTGGTQDGSDITLELGESADCTITNDDAAPSLTLRKIVVNDNGGTAPITGWTLSADGPTPIAGAGGAVSDSTFEAGTYTLSESTGPAGYSPSAWQCSGGTQNGNQITVALGGSATCTITNDDIQPKLTVTKIVVNDDGGHAVVSDFPLYVGKTSVTSGIQNGFNAGTYTVSEDNLSGYTGTISGDCGTDGSVSLAVGEVKACTITNDDQPAVLHVVKVVVNDDGGTKTFTDFGFRVNNGNITSFEADGQNDLTVPAGTYTVVEPAVSGYSTTYDNCSGIVIPNGGEATCTVTNDDQPATLHVVKVLHNDNGGNNAVTDFAFSVNGDDSVSFEADGQNDLTVPAGTYTVTEDAAPGYETSYDNCSEVIIPNGGSATCTVTNDDIAPTLTLTKVVVNDDGGNAAPDDFDLTVAGGAVLSGVKHSYTANVPLALNESALPGYTFTGISGDRVCPDVLGGTVTLNEGDDVSCTITNDDVAPTITLIKSVDSGTAAPDDFGLNLGGTFVDSGKSNQVLANTPYTIDETGLAGYTFTGLTGDEACPSVLGGTVTLTEGENVTCTIHNTRDTGTLIIHKVIDSDGDLTTVGDQAPGAGWEFTVNGQGGDMSDPGAKSTGADGTVTFTPVTTGLYNVTETVTAGYDLVDADCGNLDGTTAYSVAVTTDAVTECTFYNTPNGSIHGYKWNDVDGNGQYGEESKLGDWTINLYRDSGEGWDLVGTTVTDSDTESQDFGWYWFTHLVPGGYKVCEVLESGWTQTYPSANDGCHLVTLPDGNPNNLQEESNFTASAPVYAFGNRANPVLTIAKTNDAGGDKVIGDTVKFTLSVTLAGSNLSDVHVVDLPADGFTYQTGSWTADKNGLPFSVSEPTYASPGTWNLGDMVPGDVITLTYLTKIADGTDPGKYKDLALAYGCEDVTESCTLGSENVLLSEGINSTFVNGSFVGTDVNVVKTTQETGSVDIEKEGEILGATLPATGAPTPLIIAALMSIIGGLYLLLRKKGMRKVIPMLVGLFLMGNVSGVNAAGLVSVRVEDPRSPSRSNTFDISFTMLDIAERTPVADCFVKKPGADTFTHFDVTKVASKTSGDSDVCHVDSTVIGNGGTYTFYVRVTAGADTVNSSEVTVDYDTNGPGTPTSFAKEHPATCQWIIKFHTAADNGATKYVEIYSSTETSFPTDSGTRVGTVTIGSDEAGQFTHDRSGDDCNKTWYYVIRAFDSAGNQSAHIGDTVTIVSGSAATTTAPLTVTGGTGNVGRGGQSESPSPEGAVEGASTESPSPTPVESGSGLIQGIRDVVTGEAAGPRKWLLLALAVVILWRVYEFARTKKS